MDISTLNFTAQELAGAVAESGLANEFPLEPEAQNAVAATGFSICALALAARTDADFDSGLVAIAGPETDDELAFLMGFMYHVRDQVLRAFATAQPVQEDLRRIMHARIERVRELCAAAGAAGC